MAKDEEIFLDTSILIALMVHAPEAKKSIREQLSNHVGSVTGEVVKQEFKRRLLKEALYLLNQFERLKSYNKVMRHITDILPSQLNRKRNICLETLQTISENNEDGDLTERAQSYLSMLLRFGPSDLERLVDRMVEKSGCACARRPIVRKRGSFDFGTDKCSRSDEPCGVVDFLAENRDIAGAILEKLQGISQAEKSDELSNAQMFLENVLPDIQASTDHDPCLRVGDLLISFESVGIPVFYTMNRVESSVLCPVLQQTLIVRPRNYNEKDDVIPAGDTQ